MATRVALHHVTRYVYDREIQLSPQLVRLRPAPHCRTPILAYSAKVTPSEQFVGWQQDPFGNHVARYVFPKKSNELTVAVDLVAELTTINPFDFFLEESVEHFPFAYEPALLHDLQTYLEVVETGACFAQLVGRARDDVARPGRRMVDVLVDLNRLVHRALRYEIRMEPGVFTPEETLERGHGSCRDFAWLLVNLLRSLGLAARFVSGYSIQLKLDQKPLDGPQGVDEDCCDLHAWAETFLPGAGWVGLDATSGLFASEGHIPLACTAEPSAAAPITGSFAWDKRPGEEDDELGCEFDVVMQVTRVEDRPRPTRSYSEEQWQAILAAGDAVERALEAGDVRLTMGGEPTFVSIDDMDSPEWSTAAMGPRKEERADALARRLWTRFAEGGFLHHGLGKWYPGESLPRWAYSIFWRKDGEPVWRDPALIAGSQPRHDGPEQARAFVRALVGKLGIEEGYVLPAYEDVWYWLWRERRLPVNVDPFDAKLEDEEERARLRRIFGQGLGSVVGWTLPLRADEMATGTEWQSGAWLLRDERLYLTPGDSPMGLRLPLDTLPWTTPEDLLADAERDPFAPRPPLPARRALEQPRPGNIRRGVPMQRGVAARPIVRTALCVEPRNGRLHVFLPPVGQLEHYLDLLAKVEACAAELRLPVRLEGYAPPGDPRLHKLSVTPDPGVIEVNVQPASSWRQLVENTTALYEDARQVHLGTDKFMVDGRHSGTGGGNHVVIGGDKASDSPLLRKPELLRSLIAYFINHPSLSYLFSGQFVGPTSQAPRMDEARQDSLYELEAAFGALAAHKGTAPPWLVDRLFRHLLVDVTGNGHRTELCLDKLFSPDSSTGRLGLLEMRGFEMPPDARMSCAQQLLVRALVASFWQKPYEQPLVRWGTSLHDRFMLPHFVWQDIADVTSELERRGVAIDPEWFRPHWEFRFPRHGVVAIEGVELEIRQAIEPWHVLGEEPGAGGTVRYVDSSVERVEVLARGLVPGRHIVACNGRRVPLHPTGRAGEGVAGVRYKAWKPPSSLHPTLNTDVPLTFDLVDEWAGRAVGGCTYNVAHPAGRHYDTYPRTGLEAEARRAARFQPFGHTPGKMAPPVETLSLEQPLTLDLRRPV
jgi:uncharacterized protein (DUF2126 family)/transglutaminase-like putative cysteine protease